MAGQAPSYHANEAAEENGEFGILRQLGCRSYGLKQLHDQESFQIPLERKHRITSEYINKTA